MAIAGVPPLAGFFGKLYIFLAAIEAGLYTLAIIGVLASVVAERRREIAIRSLERERIHEHFMTAAVDRIIQERERDRRTGD